MSKIIYVDKRVYKENETPFIHQVAGLELKFSSYFYMFNFIDRFDDKLKILTDRLQPYLPEPHTSKVKGLEQLNALNLYRNIEKRFYHVTFLETQEVITCPTDLVVNLTYSKE